MSSIEKKKLIAPLMDRLICTSESPQYARPQAILSQLRESVRRDLEWLFNTRCCGHTPSEELTHLKKSLLNYGLPDLTTVNFTSKEDRERFCRQVEGVINDFEPRVKSAKVTINEKIDVEDPTVRFRVEAVLHATAAQETIIFDSAFNPISHAVDLAEIS